MALARWSLVARIPVALPGESIMQAPCLSYAPFRRAGHTPFDPLLRVSAEQLEEDLRILSGVTRCVRTYGVDLGLEQVPAVASKLGMKVLLGAWIGGDPDDNLDQLELALRLARDYPDSVSLLIVGNEVLLRGDQRPDALAQLLARARRESTVPVAYADVWEFWRRHQATIAAHVDVAAIHVLPYWEDEPVAVGQAVDHVIRITGDMVDGLSPIPVLIGETGWPAAGRQRGPAVPGGLEQAYFTRAMLADRSRLPPLWGPGLNLIEGFDQPWKRKLEGAMGGYWGIFDADGQPRVPIERAIWSDPGAWRIPFGMLVGLALSLALAGPRRWVAAFAGGAVLGGLAALHVEAIRPWLRSPAETAVACLWAIATFGCAAFAAARFSRIAAGEATEPVHRAGRPSLAEALAQPGSPAVLVFAGLQMIVVLLAATTALALAIDPRYRPLDWTATSAAAAMLLALAFVGDRLSRDAWAERALGLVCAACAPVVLFREGIDNGSAVAVALTWLTLCVALWWPHRESSGPLNARSS
jgi:exo-beta-1,3-glucanase (GH17 family)